MRSLAVLAAVLALASPARAQVETISAVPDRATVVVYRDEPVNTSELLQRANDDAWTELLRRQGLALIVETRTLDLPAGEAVIRFRGVATGIVPQTASLTGLPGEVVERNTDFDLLTPTTLMDRSVGQPVRVIRTNPRTGERVTLPALLLSGANGPVLNVGGQVEALDCQGLTQGLIFDSVPDGLGDQPVLSMRVRVRTPGRHVVTLAYLTTGLQWSADYVAEVRPDGRSLALTGWITLANFGGASFPAADVQVVAGNLNRDEDTVPVEPMTEEVVAGSCWPMDTTGGIAPPPPPAPPRFSVREPAYGVAYQYSGDGTDIEEIVVTGSRIRVKLGELGDYKVYSLPEPTDVNARQTKQVRFLDQPDVRFSTFYHYGVEAENIEDEAQPADLYVRLRNEESEGLGLPLPGGGVSLFETRDGVDILAGQASFIDKGVGLPVELRLGESQDVRVLSEIIDDDRVEIGGATHRWYQVKVVVANDKPWPVTAEIAPMEAERRDFRILRASRRSVVTEGGYPAWRFTVPAGESAELTYTVRFNEDW